MLCNSMYCINTYIYFFYLSTYLFYSHACPLVFRVWVPWWGSAGLLPGPARLCNLPDDAHALVGGMQWSVPARSLLCQPEDQAPQIHVWVQRWHLVQRRGGEEHQVRLCGLHVVQRREAERKRERRREKESEREREREMARVREYREIYDKTIYYGQQRL